MKKKRAYGVELTDKQRKVLRTIFTMTADGRPPTCRELMEVFGFKSTNAVSCHLRSLTKKGYMTVDPVRARGIVLTGASLGLTVRDDESGARLLEAVA